MELYPSDGGYASLFMSSNDLLNCCYDGVNTQGLTVALMSATSTESEPEPFAVGLNELQLMKFLLDTCANVTEAKQALLLCQHYYAFTPCQFIIGDDRGEAFVFEVSPGRNKKHFTDANNSPLAITNHSLYYSKIKMNDTSPTSQITGSSPARLKRLHQQLNKPQYSLEDVMHNNQSVFAGQCQEAPASRVMERTLWHSVYNASMRSLEISFYLGEGSQSKPEVIRSDYFKFTLEQ